MKDSMINTAETKSRQRPERERKQEDLEIFANI